MVRKNFYSRGNDAFVCENCGEHNSKLIGSYRNHCTKCLYSKHVDVVAGDRLATCQQLMKPMFVTQESKKGWVITHQCPCGHIKRNRVASDDDFEVIIELTKQNHSI